MKEAKLAVMMAKIIVFDRLDEELGVKGQDRKLYKLSKARERKSSNLDQVKYFKDEEGKVLVTEALIRQRWQTYFHKLLNKKRGEEHYARQVEAFRESKECWLL